MKTIQELIKEEADKQYYSQLEEIPQLEFGDYKIGFIAGAEWLLQQYNGITPEQVERMSTAFDKIYDKIKEIEQLRSSLNK